MGDRFLSSACTGRKCTIPIRAPNASPRPNQNLASMGRKFHQVLGLGSGGRLLGHFQPLILYLIIFLSATQADSSVRIRAPLGRELPKTQTRNRYYRLSREQQNNIKNITSNFRNPNPRVSRQKCPFWGQFSDDRTSRDDTKFVQDGWWSKDHNSAKR